MRKYSKEQIVLMMKDSVLWIPQLRGAAKHLGAPCTSVAPFSEVLAWLNQWKGTP